MEFRIPLTRGLFAIVDEQDYDGLSAFKWHAQLDGYTNYAVRLATTCGRRKMVIMHRVIAGVRGSLQVDHINGEGLDNRRANLRVATNGQNRSNARKGGKATLSQYKGVSWHRLNCKWIAQIQTNGVAMHLGYFVDEADAARAYDAAAMHYFGEFARLNFQENGALER